MELIEDRRFYVYIYLDPFNYIIGEKKFNYGEYCFRFEPFYIGRGCNNRLFVHIKESVKIEKLINNDEFIENSYNEGKIDTINEIFRLGGIPIIYKLKENLTIFEAKEFEVYLIKLIGRKDKDLGPLTNLTDGGEGVYNLPLESLIKINKKRKGKTWEEIYGEVKAKKLKEKQSKVKKGTISFRKNKTYEELYTKEKSNKIKNKIKNNARNNSNFGMKGKHLTEDAKIKISKAEKGKPTWNKDKINCYSEETKQKWSETRKGMKWMVKNGSETTVKPNDIQKYIDKGWRIGRKNNLPTVSEETRKKMGNSHKGNKAWNYRQDIDNNIEKIIKLKRQGMYIKDIAKMFEIDRHTLSRKIKKFNGN